MNSLESLYNLRTCLLIPHLVDIENEEVYLYNQNSSISDYISSIFKILDISKIMMEPQF